MKQYCRYCSNCIVGDAVYCEALKMTMTEEKVKRVNRCKGFVFNEIDVFDLEKRYKPRKAKMKQGRLF